MTQSPPHESLLHCGVGVGGATGTHWHSPESVVSHCPGREGSNGQGKPGGHLGEMTQSPPHESLLHCGVGVG
jgi:hypothetical protein